MCDAAKSAWVMEWEWSAVGEREAVMEWTGKEMEWTGKEMDR